MMEFVIARFSHRHAAELAASFLRSHGVKTRVPSFYFSESLGTSAGAGVSEYAVIVRSDQAEKARTLLNRVRAGEFVGEEASDDPRRRLGAQLSEELLPASGFEAPSRLAALGPFVGIAALFILAMLGAALFRF